MKTKVLKYDSTGNKVVAGYMELQPLRENIYTALVQENEYGNTGEDVLYVIFEVNGTCFVYHRTYRNTIERESYLSEITECYKNWIGNVLEAARQQKYIRLLEIRVFEEAGLDMAPLLQSREAALKRKEEEARERERKAAEEKERRETEWQRKLDKCKQQFLSGELITGEEFLEIAKRDNFDIHIRTKGTFNSRVRQLNKSGGIRYSKPRGSRTPDFSGCHKAIAGYLKFLETIPNP